MAILDRLPGDFLTGRSGGASLPALEEAPQVAAQAELHLCEGVWREAGPDVAVLPRAARGSGTVALLVEFRERPEVWACRIVVEAVDDLLTTPLSNIGGQNMTSAIELPRFQPAQQMRNDRIFRVALAKNPDQRLIFQNAQLRRSKPIA